MGRKGRQKINISLVGTKLFMSKFVTKLIESVKGKQQFRQLIIVDDKEDIDKLQAEITGMEIHNKLIDEKKGTGDKKIILPGVLDLFEESLEGKYKSPYKSMLTYFNLVATLQNVPPNKFKFINHTKERVKEFEFKKGDLRVYGIDIFGGKLIMYCGYKNQQSQDIEKFRSLKKQFLEIYDVQQIENGKRRIDTK